MQINLPDVATGGVAGGLMDNGQLDALQKALTAGYGSDPAQFTGGSALRIQSLDKTMKSTIQDNEHFVLFNTLAKSGAGATVDEWTERSSIGGFLGGTTNSETGNINAAQGEYKRRVAQVKYLMTRAEVSLVATLGNNIAAAKAVEAQAAALRLLTDAEYLCFEGDADVVATEFSGIYAQMVDGVVDGSIDGGNILDAAGSSLASIDHLNKAAKQVAGYRNFGRPTDIFMPLSVQADFDTGLDPAFRVPLPTGDGGLKLGAPVIGIRTSHGNIKTRPDVFIPDADHEAMIPFEVHSPGLATANTGLKPTVAVTDTDATAGSKFTAPQAGNYYYAIAGLNASGQSDLVKTGQTAVAAGDRCRLTITRSAGAQETGYAIYRSRLNGPNASSDLRLIKRIPSGGATTVFDDRNEDIPGSSKAYVMNMSTAADAISWRQLLPMMEFQLYPTQAATVPWAQLLFGYLRLTKRRQHAVIKNIVPDSAAWKPFA